MSGQSVQAEVERVVDGDTVRVLVDGKSVSMRVQCLDTEESQAGSDKPVTPWGKKTSEIVKALLKPGMAVEVLLQSGAPLFASDGGIAVDHLDNHKRLLGLLRLPEGLTEISPPTNDFQEFMIYNGYSPYFVKYGRVPFKELDNRYAAAERAAQANDRGLWNQLEVNGTISRDYAALGVWWELRAQLIDEFRRKRSSTSEISLFDTRLDYPRLVTLATEQQEATVFVELRSLVASGRHALIDTGSQAQPFKLFIPEADLPERAPLRRLIANRYLGSSESKPGRNFAYVSGRLQLYREAPELILTDISQLSDSPPGGQSEA